MKKNIGTFKSHICKSCDKLAVGNNGCMPKICSPCSLKQTVLEDIKELNHFELFNMKLKFDIDSKLLEKEYKQLQKLVHPDLISSLKDSQAIKEAEEVSSHINKAYGILKDDFKRAKLIVSYKYLFSLF